MFIIGICDKDNDAGRIQTICTSICRNHEIEIMYHNFSDGDAVIYYCENRDNPRIDLLFLDIEMDGANGNRLMEYVKKTDQIWKIIFHATDIHLVLQAFSHKTIGFLQKPVKKSDIEKMITEVWVAKQGNLKLQLQSDIGKQDVRVKEILYFEGAGSYTRVHVNTKNGKQKMLISRRLGELEQKLQPFLFVRVHKSYVVNFSKVMFIDSDLHMEGIQERIPIGRVYRNAVTRKYEEYMQWRENVI